MWEKRREGPDAGEEQDIEKAVEDYRAKVTRILAGTVKADQPTPLESAPREEPAGVFDAARDDDETTIERDADEGATARTGPSLRIL